MSALYERFRELPVEKALFGLDPRENVTEYFCYPEGPGPSAGKGVFSTAFWKGTGRRYLPATRKAARTGSYIR